MVAAGDAVRAEGSKAYLKSDRQFAGVTVPDGRRIVRDELRAHPLTTPSDVVDLATVLWSGRYFESRRFACEVLQASAKQLDVAHLEFLESLVRNGETWAIVDPLAIDVVGSVSERFARETAVVLDRWSLDPTSFWVRRASILALLKPMKKDAKRWSEFERRADALIDEREFFIQKAIGWIGRDVARRQPEIVRPWYLANESRMTVVARREIVKYL
jgi:3-methyladenine DNA glycosylase AlkD